MSDRAEKSHPWPGVRPFFGNIPSDVCFWDFLPFSAHNAPDGLFISSTCSAVAVDAAGGVPPDASTTLTLGVGYSLVSVVYLIRVPHLGRRTLRHSVPFEGKVAQVRLYRWGLSPARPPRLIPNGIPGSRSCTCMSQLGVVGKALARILRAATRASAMLCCGPLRLSTRFILRLFYVLPYVVQDQAQLHTQFFFPFSHQLLILFPTFFFSSSTTIFLSIGAASCEKEKRKLQARCNTEQSLRISVGFIKTILA